MLKPSTHEMMEQYFGLLVQPVSSNSMCMGVILASFNYSPTTDKKNLAHSPAKSYKCTDSNNVWGSLSMSGQQPHLTNKLYKYI